jgi:hypothetical protein
VPQRIAGKAIKGKVNRIAICWFGPHHQQARQGKRQVFRCRRGNHKHAFPDAECVTDLEKRVRSRGTRAEHADHKVSGLQAFRQGIELLLACTEVCRGDRPIPVPFQHCGEDAKLRPGGR